MEQKAIFIILDISGYTRFMLSKEKRALAHAQIIISELLEEVLKHVELPMFVAKLEGDAIFLYATEEGLDHFSLAMRAFVGERLLLFFDVFYARLVDIRGHMASCNCGGCRNADKLRIKAVIHSGMALFYRIGRFEEVAGQDVILVHRLLKNSVPSREYILMTKEAYREITFPCRLPFTEHRENYEDVGDVKAFVFIPPSRDEELDRCLARFHEEESALMRGLKKLKHVGVVFSKYLLPVSLKVRRLRPLRNLKEE